MEIYPLTSLSPLDSGLLKSRATLSFDTYLLSAHRGPHATSGAGDGMVTGLMAPKTRRDGAVRLLPSTLGPHGPTPCQAYCSHPMNDATLLSLHSAMSREAKSGVRPASFPSFEGKAGTKKKSVDFGGELPGVGAWLCHGLSWALCATLGKLLGCV